MRHELIDRTIELCVKAKELFHSGRVEEGFLILTETKLAMDDMTPDELEAFTITMVDMARRQLTAPLN